MALMSDNNRVWTITNMGRYNSYSTMGDNMKLLMINIVNVYSTSKCMFEHNEYVCR